MGMHLQCHGGKYTVHRQIATYDSLMIYSNNDGGPQGVLYRLEQYLRRERQDELNHLSFKGKSGSDEYRWAKEYWDGCISEVKDARMDAYKHPERYEFFVQ